MADEKKILRRILAGCRGELPAYRAEQLSSLVQHNLIEAPDYATATSVVLYAPQNNEVATDRIFTDAIASGRRTFYPSIVAQSKGLNLVRVEDLAQLQPGTHGILEPTGSEIARYADLERALICVPGVAFGLAGARLGRGGGYYDRLLAALPPQTITVGLAYSFQVLDRLPESPHDRRLGLIVTESTVHRGAAYRPAADAPLDQGGITRCC